MRRDRRTNPVCSDPVSNSRKSGVSQLDRDRLSAHADRAWTQSAEPALEDYIRIPNKSPMFDPQWAKNGYMEDAVGLMEKWARSKLPALNARNLPPPK